LTSAKAIAGAGPKIAQTIKVRIEHIRTIGTNHPATLL